MIRNFFLIVIFELGAGRHLNNTVLGFKVCNALCSPNMLVVNQCTLHARVFISTLRQFNDSMLELLLQLTNLILHISCEDSCDPEGFSLRFVVSFSVFCHA